MMVVVLVMEQMMRMRSSVVPMSGDTGVMSAGGTGGAGGGASVGWQRHHFIYLLCGLCGVLCRLEPNRLGHWFQSGSLSIITTCQTKTGQHTHTHTRTHRRDEAGSCFSGGFVLIA